MNKSNLFKHDIENITFTYSVLTPYFTGNNQSGQKLSHYIKKSPESVLAPLYLIFGNRKRVRYRNTANTPH